MNKFIFVYIPTSSKQEAKTISHTLLDKKLIACANIFPVESMYWWEAKIEEASEYIVIAKTKTSFYQKVKAEVKKLHSYEVPAIIKIEVEGNKKYLTWLKGLLPESE
jgi:periplasmic divalent cation tolerance protein